MNPIFTPLAAAPSSPWADGTVPAGPFAVPRVKTTLDLADRLGAWKVRWDLGRMHYIVTPGLYAVGDPGAQAPVLVTANYKLSFDHLRATLSGRHAWILVLDTHGINVWCAAGKGTFGTDELVRRVQATQLDQVVAHRRLVVPQLGAPGVCAADVRERCGFRVEFGPVRALDLPAFLDARHTATADMRRVRFPLGDRLVLVPVELVIGARQALLVAAGLVLLGGASAQGWSAAGVRAVGLPAAGLFLGAFLAAAVLGPALLPWLPGRAFAVKGAALGIAVFATCAGLGWGMGSSWLHIPAWGLAIPALSSFVVMNFTGATTFTSQSGVLREMRVALPLQIGAAVLGACLWLVGLFVGGR